MEKERTRTKLEGEKEECEEEKKYWGAECKGAEQESIRWLGSGMTWIYLFLCSLFNNSVSSTVYRVSNGGTISEKLIGKNVD
jgi:hypothetical protein